MSVAFCPAPREEGLLSVYDGDLISVEQCWQHYTAILQLASSGVWAVTVSEVEESALTARPDPLEPPESPAHAVIDFSTLESKKRHRAIAKILAAKAEARGCLRPA